MCTFYPTESILKRRNRQKKPLFGIQVHIFRSVVNCINRYCCVRALDNQRQGVPACAQSRRHPSDDDRADEFPEGSVDDDRHHVRHRHVPVLRGGGAGHATRTTTQTRRV